MAVGRADVTHDEKRGVVLGLRRLATALRAEHAYRRQADEAQDLHIVLAYPAGACPAAISGDSLRIVRKLLRTGVATRNDSPPGPLARWWESEAPQRGAGFRPDPQAPGCRPDLADALSIVRQLEKCGIGKWPFLPPNAIDQLRDIADRLENALAKTEHTPIGLKFSKDQLKLRIRQQVKAESKTTLTDDILVAAYRQYGSLREAAVFLSQQTGQDVSKDKVHRAVERAGGIKAVLNTEDSNSIKRTVASQRRDRQKKFASPTQPPEI